MIAEFVERWEKNKGLLRDKFATAHPANYESIVKSVVEILHDEDEYDSPDPLRIHCIDDGDWQGTLLFVVGATGYQPSTYWAVKVGYGSCSGCDTLQAISGYSDDPPTEEQTGDYMTLALHVVQGLKEIGGDA